MSECLHDCYQNSHFWTGVFLRLVRMMTTISSIVTMKPTPPMATMAHAHPGTEIPDGVCSDGSAEPGLKTCMQHYNFY